MDRSAFEHRFGRFRVLSGSRALLKDDRVVAISPKALGVLTELLRDPGQVVSKADLLERIWAGSFVEDGNLAQTIFVLRKVFAEDFESSPIETVPRIGYRFRVPVEIAAPSSVAVVAPAVAVAPEVMTPVQGAGRGFRSLVGNRWMPMIVLASMVAIVAAMVVSVKLRRRVLAESRHAHRRVAVLGFQDLSQAAQTEWLRSAFQVTLSADLGAGSDIEIVPVEDVDRAERELGVVSDAGPDVETLHRLCDNLDCDDLITGSYLVVGGSIRVDTHLVRASDGAVLGSDSQTETFDHLLPLIAANSQVVRREFGLPAEAAGEVESAVSADPAAFALYSKGLEKMRLYDGPAAMKFFEGAIAADPAFPQAHMALSSALTVTGQNARAEQEARLAQSLAGNLPRRQRLVIEARCQQTENHFDEAAATFQTLATFYPEDREYVWMRSAMLEYAGHLAEAMDVLLPVLSRGQSAEGGAEQPLDPRMYSQLADVYSEAGDWKNSLLWAQRGAQEARRRGATVLYERLLTTQSQAELYLHQIPLAESQTEQALELARQFDDRSGELRALNRMGQIETEQGKLPEARTLLEQALALETAEGELQRQIHTLSALGHNLANSGDHAAAMAMFARELKLAKSFEQPNTTLGVELDIAREEADSGDRQAGLAHLATVQQRAHDLGDKELESEVVAELRKSAL
jgi:DNA-binding winged helix-turn-helix (wHTH) protein/tetratricopeptide (TPR) repeat protein